MTFDAENIMADLLALPEVRAHLRLVIFHAETARRFDEEKFQMILPSEQFSTYRQLIHASIAASLVPLASLVVNVLTDWNESIPRAVLRGLRHKIGVAVFNKDWFALFRLFGLLDFLPDAMQIAEFEIPTMWAEIIQEGGA